MDANIVKDYDEKQWNEFINDGREIPIYLKYCTENAIMAAKKNNEIYIGGNESPLLLQILAIDEDENIDIIGSILYPDTEVKILYSTRGPNVFNLITKFWENYPDSPVVLQVEEKYEYILCKVGDHAWSVGPISASHYKKLMESESLQNLEEHIQIFIPDTKIESHETDNCNQISIEDAEKKRAAICRR